MSTDPGGGPRWRVAGSGRGATVSRPRGGGADASPTRPYPEAWGWIKNLMRRWPSISGTDDRLFSLVVNFGVRKAVSEIH